MEARAQARVLQGILVFAFVVSGFIRVERGGGKALGASFSSLRRCGFTTVTQAARHDAVLRTRLGRVVCSDKAVA